MKILTLSNFYPEHSGGIEFVALNLVRRWRIRHRVRWMACDVKTYPHLSQPDDIPLPALNFTEEKLGFPYPIPLGRSVFQIFDQVKWCDIVHIHDSLYIANIIAYIASRWYHKPLVVTQHVALVPYRQIYKNKLQKLAYRIIGTHILEHAKKVVFISKRVQGWFEERVNFRNHTVFIPNGIDWELFFPPTADERATCRTELGLSTSETVCLFVGRFTQKKGINLIHKIAQARPNYKWLLIGRTELDPREWNLANIQVISSLPQAELRRFYIAADLFVLPSIGEGFPLSVQEALSCGLPAAVSNETANYLPNAPLVRLDTSSLLNILQTLDNLLATKNQLLDLRNLSATYAKRWDWVNVSSQYEEIFNELASSY